MSIARRSAWSAFALAVLAAGCQLTGCGRDGGGRKGAGAASPQAGAPAANDAKGTPDPKRAPEKSRETALIDELVALFGQRPDGDSGSAPGSARCYRKGNSPEVILEVSVPQEAQMALTQGEKDTMRKELIESLGTALSVGQIREYGKHGIVFTLRYVSAKGNEFYRISIPFEGLLKHWGHPEL